MVVRGAFMGAGPNAAPDRAQIDFVVTAPAHRVRAVATALVRQLVATSGHRNHVLRDIRDSNEAALRVYRRLGFVEYTRRKARFSGVPAAPPTSR